MTTCSSLSALGERDGPFTTQTIVNILYALHSSTFNVTHTIENFRIIGKLSVGLDHNELI